jgi:hypothetical protein
MQRSVVWVTKTVSSFRVIIRVLKLQGTKLQQNESFWFILYSYRRIYSSQLNPVQACSSEATISLAIVALKIRFSTFTNASSAFKLHRVSNPHQSPSSQSIDSSESHPKKPVDSTNSLKLRARISFKKNVSCRSRTLLDFYRGLHGR